MADRATIISAVQYPPDSLREYVSVDFPTPGVVNGGDLVVSQHAGTPGMSVDVAAGFVMLKGILSSVTQGTYPYFKDALETKTIAAADPTNPRRDLVCAVISDSAYAVDGTPNTQNIRVLTGTPAGSPVDPAIPGTWSAYQILARVAVAANATSIVNANITDLRTFCMPRPRSMSTTLVGPPTTGTAAIGDEAIDKWGAVWRCYTAGTPGLWLWAGGGRYGFRAHQNASQNLTNAAFSIINFDTVEYDPISSLTTGAACKYTAPVPGVYHFDGEVAIAAGGGGAAQFLVSLFKNGVENWRGAQVNYNGSFVLQVGCDVAMVAGDYVDIRGYQSSGTLQTTAPYGTSTTTLFSGGLVRS
jgi:hypothetical protein